MTSISATAPAALLILQQPVQSVLAAEDGKPKEKNSDLVMVANGISGEPSDETAKASFAVSVAFIEMDEKNQATSAAVEFINSDKFGVSDPGVKQTLKALIAEKGWDFMVMVRQQEEAHGGLSKEDLYALVIPQFIARNRDRFTDGEFELAFKFEDRPGLIVFVPDSEGNSTYLGLIQAMKDAENYAHKTGKDTQLREVTAAYQEYVSGLTTGFGFDPSLPDAPMMLDINQVQFGAWMK